MEQESRMEASKEKDENKRNKEKRRQKMSRV